MTESASHFFCRLCNRRYRWSTAVAGKNLRCHCGETIAVPVISPDAGAPPAVARKLDYQAGDESSSPIALIIAHSWRNLVFPIAYAAIAILILLKSLPNLFGTTAAVGAAILIFGTAVLVAGAIMLFGLIRGWQLQITPISFAIATFKILAIMLMADAAAVGLTSYWVNIGVFTKHMGIGISLLGLGVLASFFAIYIVVIGGMLWAGSYGAFSNQDDDFVAVGFTVTTGAWIAHFILFIAVLIGIHIYRVATYVPPPPPPPPPVQINTGPPSLPVTDADQKIIEKTRSGFMVIEGRRWARMRIRNDHGAAALVETMYNAGADRVFVDMESNTDGHPSLVYAQLPDNPAQQASCKAASDKYLADTNTAPLDVPPDTYKKFIVIPIK